MIGPGRGVKIQRRKVQRWREFFIFFWNIIIMRGIHEHTLSLGDG